VDAVDYLTSFLLLAMIVGGFASSAHSLRTWLLPGWSGAPGLLAVTVLAVSIAIVACEALGAFGLLNSAALTVTALAPALALRWTRPSPLGDRAPCSRPSGRALAFLSLGAAVLTATHWAGPVLHSFDVGIYRQDSTWYHLPFAAWFAQTGSIGDLLHTDPLKLAVWYYPLNSELLHTLGMVVLDNDLLSPLLNYGWLGLALLAAWCAGRPVGLAAVTALGGLLVLNSDMLLVQAGNAPGDIAALACLLASIAVLINASGPGNKLEDLAPGSAALAIAGLAAGLAIGAKVTMLVPVAVISAGVLLAGGRAGAGRRAALWLGGLGLTGSFWYLRNLIHAGNPLPWLQSGALPGPAQEAAYPRPAHSISEYLADRHAWSEYFLPGFAETLGPLWPLVLFAALAGIVLGLRRGNGSLVRILALAGAATLVAHVFNPISASGPDGAPYGFASNLRYAAPGLAIGLVLLPLCETRRIATRLITPAYAVIFAVVILASNEWMQPSPAAAIAIGTASVLIPAWLLSDWKTRYARPVIACLAALALLAGYAVQRHYFENRYLADAAPALDNPGFRATPQWKLIQSWARDLHGLRVGIVGSPAAYGQYLLYGPELSNEVRYLGEPGPHGGFTSIRSCRRWREQVNAGDFDAVVITPEDPASPFLPPQVAWTAAPGAVVPAVNAFPAAVYLIVAPLDPAQCARIESPTGIPADPRSQLPPDWWRGAPTFPGTAARRHPG
jgi:hypothetical protein